MGVCALEGLAQALLVSNDGSSALEALTPPRLHGYYDDARMAAAVADVEGILSVDPDHLKAGIGQEKTKGLKTAVAGLTPSQIAEKNSELLTKLDEIAKLFVQTNAALKGSLDTVDAGLGHASSGAAHHGLALVTEDLLNRAEASEASLSEMARDYAVLKGRLLANLDAAGSQSGPSSPGPSHACDDRSLKALLAQQATRATQLFTACDAQLAAFAHNAQGLGGLRERLASAEGGKHREGGEHRNGAEDREGEDDREEGEDQEGGEDREDERGRKGGRTDLQAESGSIAPFGDTGQLEKIRSDLGPTYGTQVLPHSASRVEAKGSTSSVPVALPAST